MLTSSLVFCISVLPVGAADATTSAREAEPRVFLLDGNALSRAKKRIADGDDSLRPALDALIARADAAFEKGPFSVMQKKFVPPSGDKHDYMSLGGYWWPDPSKPGGKPYMRRDGEVNPEGHAYDRPKLAGMSTGVTTLGLAYYFTGREAYADYAAKLLRVWFLEDATRMNPHLEYGQAIPGRTEGRGIGIIDTRSFVWLVDAVGLIEGSSWSKDDTDVLREWFRAYLTWLLESDKGKDEASQPNNHGTFYDVQVASYALFVGRLALAKSQLAEVTPKRIASQIEPDGRQPWELRRTLSFGYSCGNLEGFFDAASMAQRLAIDLWRYETPDGQNIRKALDYICQYADGTTPWPHESIKPVDLDRLVPFLRRAAIVYDEPRYEALIAKLPGTDAEADLAHLLYPPPERVH